MVGSVDLNRKAQMYAEKGERHGPRSYMAQRATGPSKAVKEMPVGLPPFLTLLQVTLSCFFFLEHVKFIPPFRAFASAVSYA